MLQNIIPSTRTQGGETKMNQARKKFSRSHSSRPDWGNGTSGANVSRLFSWEQAHSVQSPMLIKKTSFSMDSPRVWETASTRRDDRPRATENVSPRCDKLQPLKSEAPNRLRRNMATRNAPVQRSFSVDHSHITKIHGRHQKNLVLLSQTRPSSEHKASKPHKFLDNLVISNGTKKAVLVAATYAGTKGVRKLNSSPDALSDMYKVLTKDIGFTTENIWVLSDDLTGVAGCNNIKSPTRANILHSMTWLVGGAKEGDALIFIFIGHTVQIPRKDDTNGEEFIDCLLPVDYPRSAPIADSKILSMLMHNLTPGSHLTTIIDCGHLALPLKLPYMYEPRRENEKVVFEEVSPWAQETSMFSRGYPASLMGRRHRKKEFANIKEKLALEQRDAFARSLRCYGSVVSISSHTGADIAQLNRQTSFSGLLVKTLSQVFRSLVLRNKSTSYKRVMHDLLATLAPNRDAPIIRLSASHLGWKEMKFPLFNDS